METRYLNLFVADSDKISIISAALKNKDRYTQGHARRVATYAMRLAHRLGLSAEEVDNIGVGGLLHDIGKIGLSDRIFSNKTACLHGDMLAEVRRHPEIGVSLLEGFDLLLPVLECVQYHHERMDGSGYPCGLKAHEIPLTAKIIGVVDCFDAITTDRPYQKRKSCSTALAILRRMSFHELCPDLVAAFIADIAENGMIAASSPNDYSVSAARSAREHPAAALR